ncbi:hypothetical protein APS_1022 [Acetobacter pasteurianus subsp. pasteurianus LMG 1262 = NBRC 106471]|nr:hypothetical protein APS_1022 [Acetobacter pasteurianus subsp. pasteurianus LMG 1262 = NBRC 106471]
MNIRYNRKKSLNLSIRNLISIIRNNKNKNKRGNEKMFAEITKPVF